MRLIITMAGASSRFFKAGYKEQKYKLICNGKSIFEWSMLSLEKWFSSYEFTFVLRDDVSFITEQCKKIGIVNFNFVILNEVTSGQAETVLNALTEKDEAIGIYNIDTYVKGLSELTIPKCDGWIPVFSAEGDHWSFTIANTDNDVLDIAEKVRISEWATIGFYYFKSSKVFEKYYALTYSKDFQTETYIAPMYKTMLMDGMLIKQAVIEAEKIIPLGTPAEVKNFDADFDEVNIKE